MPQQEVALKYVMVINRQLCENERNRRGRNKTDLPSLAGEGLTKTRLELENTYGQIREISAQLVSRARFTFLVKE